MSTVSQQVGLKRRVRLVSGVATVMPMTWSVFHPTVLLPCCCDTWSTARCRIVLLHELAHVKRFDCLWLLIAKLARAAYWYNPLAWWAVKQLRITAEQACDDRVLRCGQAPPEYARQLLEFVASLRGHRRARRLALTMARRSTLEGRLRSILDATRSHRALTRTGAAAAVLTLAAVLLPASMLKVSAQSAGADSRSKSSSLQTALPAASRKITVLVVSADGAPRPSVFLGTVLHERAPGQTDAAGRCDLMVPEPGETHWYAQSRTTRSFGLFTIPAGEVTQPLVVKLDLGSAELDGRVTDRQGNGVVGAKVEARAVLADGRSVPTDAVATDDAGYYVFGEVPVGTPVSLQVRLVSTESAPGPWSPPLQTHVHDGAIVMANLVDPHPSRISDKPAWIAWGGAVHSQDGKPIDEADVRLVWRMPGQVGVRIRLVSSDPSGRWETFLPPDAQLMRLAISHAGFVTQSGNVTAEAPSTDELRAHTAITVLKRGVLLAGIVRDERGKAVADALVVTQEKEMQISHGGGLVQDSSMGRTAGDGTFQVPGMDRGPRDLIVYADPYPPTLVSVDIEQGMKPVEIRLSHGQRVTGTVLDAQGKPAVGATVAVRGWNYRGPHQQLQRNAVTDSSGHFVLNELPAQGVFRLSASVPGSASASIDASARVEPYQLTLAPEVRTKIRGRVVDDATGAPIGQFTIVAGVQSRNTRELAFTLRRRQMIRSAEGTFERALLPDEIAVRVVADGYLPQETPTVKAGESKEFVLRMHPGKPISGTVVNPDGALAVGANVAWVTPGHHAFINAEGKLDDIFLFGPETIVTADSNGHFELPPDRLPASLVVLDRKGYLELDAAEFKSGSSASLGAWARIEGRYTQNARPVPNASLEAWPLDADQRSRNATINWHLQISTRSDGSFVFDHIPAIPLAVGVRNPNGLASRIVLNPKPGQTQTIQIGGGGREVSGTLELPPDLGFSRVYSQYEPVKPLALIDLRPASDPDDAPVRLPEQQDPRRVLFVAEVGDGNRFVIHDVPDGQYVLHAAIHAPPQRGFCGLPVALAEATLPVSVDRSNGQGPIELGIVKAAAIPYATAGKPAPNLQALTLSGKPFSLAALRGKPVLLDFWASWCPACRAEEPHIQRIWNRYGPGGKLAVVGINLDERSEIAREAAQGSNMTWPVVHAEGGWGAANAVLRTFGVTAVPSYWLISADGIVIARDIPPVELDKTIERVITP